MSRISWVLYLLPETSRVVPLCTGVPKYESNPCAFGMSSGSYTFRLASHYHETAEATGTVTLDRFCDLEYAVRTTPAATLDGVRFKLRHMIADTCWQDCEEHFAEPIRLIADDLDRIAEGVPA